MRLGGDVEERIVLSAADTRAKREECRHQLKSRVSVGLCSSSLAFAN